MSLTIINADLTRQLLPMDECICVMEAAMMAASKGSIAIPPRMHSALIDNSASLILMPGSSKELGVYGAKMIGVHPLNKDKELPVIQGIVCLFDYDSGVPLAFIDAAEITAIRTAAVSALATRLLAREDASTCGIFGTGVQAINHINALSVVRKLDEIIIWGRDFDSAQDFARQQAKRSGLNIRASNDPACVASADLLCTVSAAAEPILKGEWVKAGTHINLVGAHSLNTREANTELIVKAEVYVDLLESVKNEGGDIMIPVAEGAIDEAHIKGEIGQLLLGDIAGRQNDEQITLFNSLGITAQDLFAASYVYRKARENKVGVLVDF